MLERLNDRRFWVWAIFSFIFVLLGFRLAQLTIVEGEKYAERALDTRLKKVVQVAKRGEIKDRNGVLLAGNKTAYSVDFMYNQQLTEEQHRMIVSLFQLLEANGEEHIGLPIIMTDKGFAFEADIQKKQWLEDNGFEQKISASRVFEIYKEQEQIPADLDKLAAQQILLLKGIYLPIRVKEMMFTYDFNRKNFLEYYDVPLNATAEQAFKAVCDFYEIDAKFTQKEAYAIAIMRHAIREKGYLKYEPITVADNVSKETAVQIQEQGMLYPNITVEIKPLRYYPQGQLASHVLGYLGKIASAQELEKFNTAAGYLRTDLIGKVGIEGRFETDLKGDNGEKWIEVNASGRFVREVGDSVTDPRFANTSPEAGKEIVLTLDIELQKAVRDYLIRTLKAIQTGGTYESPFGNTVYADKYENANTGAVVVVDVQSGEVLSMVSYPDYDVNLFSQGISTEDWRALNVNTRNPLAPRPLYNIATSTAVQPGSTFKMITGFAALQAGLDPYARYRDAGYIETKDGRTFGCWLWNKSRGAHGLVNLMEAIEVSCNYYFYSVGNGFDYSRGAKLPFSMNADKIIEAARRFGLDEASGVEIGETVVGVPDAKHKQRTLLSMLRYKLKSIGPDYFPQSLRDDEEAYNALMDAIIEMGVKTPDMSRNALIRYLQNEGGIEDETKASNLADIIKYSYFTQMNWYEGDTFNLAIGQGGHAYTPVQMAKYITAIANGGFLYDLTLVKSIDGEPTDREPYQKIDEKNYMSYLKEGMRLVAAGPRGSVKSQFKGFPITVGAKTGTAEKEGKLPPEDEEAYLLQYLRRIAPRVSQNDLELETARVLKERTELIASLYETLNSTDDEAIKQSTQKQISHLTGANYLNRGYAMRDALKRLGGKSLTDEIIDQFKADYDNFTWFVSFAPYDKPEIAVAILIPQGGKGGNGAAIAKDIYGKYFGLKPTAQQSNPTSVPSNAPNP